MTHTGTGTPSFGDRNVVPAPEVSALIVSREPCAEARGGVGVRDEGGRQAWGAHRYC